MGPRRSGSSQRASRYFRELGDHGAAVGGMTTRTTGLAGERQATPGGTASRVPAVPSCTRPGAAYLSLGRMPGSRVHEFILADADPALKRRNSLGKDGGCGCWGPSALTEWLLCVVC